MNYTIKILIVSQKMFFLIASILGFYACTGIETLPERESAWIPIYISNVQATNIQLKESQPIVNAGKIYAWKNYLFQLENNQGIHIYKLENKKPIPYKFIQLYGAQEMAIKNNTMYSNNLNDIVSIGLQNLEQIKVLSRVENVFNVQSSVLPPEKGYFECVDLDKGLLIGWELMSNVRAKCKY